MAVPRFAADGKPSPPTQAQINAAENKVKQQQAALGAQQGQLSSADAELNSLQVQAEVLTQRYDQTLVDEQRAAAAYKVTEARLQYAQRAQDASQQQLARLAASEFESGGGFGPMTSMLGSAGGPQGYLNGVGLGQVLAQNGTDTVAQAQANNVVASAFRKQAHELLAAQQADLQAASHLKLAIEAAVSRQQEFVRASQAKRNSLASQLATAKAHANALQAARQAALAAAAAAAPAGSPSVCISRVNPVGAMPNGRAEGPPKTVVEVSTTDTSRRMDGWNSTSSKARRARLREISPSAAPSV